MVIISEFIDFEAAVDDAIDIVDDNEATAGVSSDIDDFINDELQMEQYLEDYYAFTNVSRSVEDVMQGSFYPDNRGESLNTAEEVSNYCYDAYAAED